MDIQDYISLTIGILGIGGFVFSIYNNFKNPQITIEKDQIKIDENLKDKATILSQKEVESKAGLLAQQVQWEKEANEKRFGDMQKNFMEILTLNQNHLHTLETKLDSHVDENHKFVEGDIRWKTRMETMLDERLPKK